MPFQIATLYQHHDTIPVPIVGPDGQRTTLTLTLASPYSAVAKTALAALSPAEGAPLETTLHAAYAALVVGWEGVDSTEGEPIPFSAAQCAALFDACPWIYEQVVEAFGAKARFFTRGASASSRSLATSSV